MEPLATRSICLFSGGKSHVDSAFTLSTSRHTLLWLLNDHRITMISLAHKTGIRLDVIHAIVWNIEVDQETAEKVVAGLSALSGYKYTLEQVKIPIFDPKKKEQFVMNTNTGRLIDDRLCVLVAPGDKEAPELEYVLQQLGCEIVKKSAYIKVLFPAGTTRAEILPRTRYGRYTLTLPDGIQLSECQLISYPDLNTILIPDTIIERYFPGYILKHQQELDANKPV